MQTYHPTNEEIMLMAKASLRRQTKMAAGPNRRLSYHFRAAAAHRSIAAPPDLSAQLGQFQISYVGPRPAAFEKPRYGTPAYALALKIGWITAEEEKADRIAYEQRQRRSLRSCHRYNLHERPRYPEPKDTGAYVPELSARLENDRNLTDGARRCARKIAELTYRQNRQDRSLDVKVYYLMKALSRSRRTVQRYLRLLEREGYIRVDVIKSKFSRMCVGLVVQLMSPLFARHHRKSWPERKSPQTLRNPGAPKKSQNQASIFSLNYFKQEGFLIPSQLWALRCMDGVYRKVMKTLPPFPDTA